MKFFKCKKDNTIFALMQKEDTAEACNHTDFEELIPGLSDGAAEKHVPVIKQDSTKIEVFIGEAEHPMVEEHHIEWIMLETKKGAQTVYLKPGKKPHAQFVLTEDDKAVAAYEYCNLHGLWKADC